MSLCRSVFGGIKLLFRFACMQNNTSSNEQPEKYDRFALLAVIILSRINTGRTSPMSDEATIDFAKIIILRVCVIRRRITKKRELDVKTSSSGVAASNDCFSLLSILDHHRQQQQQQLPTWLIDLFLADRAPRIIYSAAQQ